MAASNKARSLKSVKNADGLPMTHDDVYDAPGPRPGGLVAARGDGRASRAALPLPEVNAGWLHGYVHQHDLRQHRGSGAAVCEEVRRRAKDRGRPMSARRRATRKWA